MPDRGDRMPSKKIAAFYKFVGLENLESLRQALFQNAQYLNLRGTILLAQEGVNGTVSGRSEDIDELVEWFRSDCRFRDMGFKFSHPEPDNPVFHRLKIRIKQEIVALKVPGVDPTRKTGVAVDADTWNTLLDDPEVLVVDTRNHYEYEVGTFPGAVDPGTRSFRGFPDYVAQNLDPSVHKKVAMFCTGGIRCEKASAYMLEHGFKEVFQLQGGILNYLETISADENRWQGECFVFDQRVAVDRNLQEADYEQCFACRRPIQPSEKASDQYKKGVSCPGCYAELSSRRRAALEERERQMGLAAERGEQHIGAVMAGARTDTNSSVGGGEF